MKPSFGTTNSSTATSFSSSAWILPHLNSSALYFFCPSSNGQSPWRRRTRHFSDDHLGRYRLARVDQTYFRRLYPRLYRRLYRRQTLFPPLPAASRAPRVQIGRHHHPVQPRAVSALKSSSSSTASTAFKVTRPLPRPAPRPPPRPPLPPPAPGPRPPPPSPGVVVPSRLINFPSGPLTNLDFLRFLLVVRGGSTRGRRFRSNVSKRCCFCRCLSSL